MRKKNLPKRAKLNKTFVPIKAGHRSFNAFIIAFNIDTTAPGLVTKSFKLVGFRKLFAAAPNEVAPAADVEAPPVFNACASAATANNSGARFLVNLSGNWVINFWRKEGRCSYDFANWPCELSRRWVRSS